ncbi:MAG TPA: serine protease [Myxococcales bacterium]|nr:serine protease [Myxococcales bacterium]
MSSAMPVPSWHIMEGQKLECSACGAEAGADSPRCETCSASLLVDLVPAELPSDPKSRYALARALAAVPGAPPFGAIRAQLDIPGAPIVRGVTRAQAAAFDSVLSRHGILTLLEPAAVERRRPIKAYVLVAGAVAAAALVILVTGLLKNRKPPSMPTGLAGQQHSIVVVRCWNQIGAGFFVEPRRVLTNAHLLCDGESPIVEIDERTKLQTTVLRHDDRVDLALLELDEEPKGIEPLLVTDASSIVRDVPVRALDPWAPRGSEWKTHDGSVVLTTDEYSGLRFFYVRLPDTLAQTGGPVVDLSGRVIGIVKSLNDKVAYAIPINYAFDRSQTAGVPMLSLASIRNLDDTRWRAFLAANGDSEEKRVSALEADLQKGPALIEAIIDHSRGTLSAVVAQKSYAPPAWPDLPFEARVHGRVYCSGKLRVFQPYGRDEYESELLQDRSRLFVEWLKQRTVFDAIHFARYDGPAIWQCLPKDERSHVMVHLNDANDDVRVSPLVASR